MLNAEVEDVPPDDLSTLSWVHGELRRSLDNANKALRRHLKEAEAQAGSDLDRVDPAVLRGARAQIHQPFGTKARQRLAHGGAADAKQLGQGLFADGFVRLQLKPDDLARQRAIAMFGRRDSRVTRHSHHPWSFCIQRLHIRKISGNTGCFRKLPTLLDKLCESCIQEYKRIGEGCDV